MKAPQAFESAILGTILEAGQGDLPPTLARLLEHAPESFDDLRHGAIAAAIRTLKAEGRAVHPAAVAEACRAEGAALLLASIANTALPSALAELEAENLWTAYRTRQTKRLLQEAAAEIEAHPLAVPAIAGNVRASLDALSGNTSCHYTAHPIGELQPQPADAGEELIRHRFLCRGSGLLLAAPAGIGKSTFALQAMLCFAVGRECLGFKPARPIRSLYLQAENDDGDLRELRDGILTGLRFSEAERVQAFANVHFVTIDDLCGEAFIREAVAPLCRAVKPDVLWLDPLLSYIGGDMSRQEVLSPWLRNHLTPVLHRYGVACVLVHHTNKPPSGKEKPNWQAGDFAYVGSGSAELANWPRAVVAIRSTGSHDVFELRLGKRGSRVGWHNPDGSPCYARFIAHGTDGIYWREATADEQPASAGRKQEHTVDEIVALLDGEKLSTADWQTLC